MSIAFNGSSSKLAWAGAIATSYPITFFGWIKPNSASKSQMCFGSADFGGDDELMAFADGAGSGTSKAFSRKDGGSCSASSGASLSSDWQPFMVVFSSKTSRTVYYGSGSAGTDSDTIAAAPSTHDRFVVGCRGKEDTLFFGGDIAEIAAWSAPLGPTEFTDLASGDAPETVASGSLIDAWSLTSTSALTGVNGRVLTPTNVTNGGTHPIPRSGGSTDGAASGAFPVVTLTAPAATATGTSSGATNGASSGALPVVSTTTPSATATGTTAGSGTVSIPPITDFGTRTVLKNVPNITADFYNISTKALVVSVTGLTSHASTGAVSAVSTSLVAGTTYRTVVEFTHNGFTYRGVWNLVSS